MENWIEVNKDKILLDDKITNRVLSVRKMNGEFQFRENCDGFYMVSLGKKDALTLVDELKNWINAH